MRVGGNSIRGRGRERKCKLGREVLTEELGFQELLKGREGRPCSGSARQLVPPTGTMNDNSLDCCTCTDGSAKRLSLDERSFRWVTFAPTRAFKSVGAEPAITL